MLELEVSLFLPSDRDGRTDRVSESQTESTWPSRVPLSPKEDVPESLSRLEWMLVISRRLRL